MKLLTQTIALVACSVLMCSCGGSSSSSKYEAVDLGLSVKWAAFNVGATSPEQFGDYFAWGETQTKDVYDWSTYKYYDEATGFTKYTQEREVLAPEDDAATVKWGGTWRMPTFKEWIELTSKCTWEKTKQKGVDGFKVTGPNGNSIFLPFAGFKVNDVCQGTTWGTYWSATSYSEKDAYYGCSGPNAPNTGFRPRAYGCTIRPVCK